jgi:hypothetical protein
VGALCKFSRGQQAKHTEANGGFLSQCLDDSVGSLQRRVLIVQHEAHEQGYLDSHRHCYCFPEPCRDSPAPPQAAWAGVWAVVERMQSAKPEAELGDGAQDKFNELRDRKRNTAGPIRPVTQSIPVGGLPANGGKGKGRWFRVCSWWGQLISLRVV